MYSTKFANINDKAISAGESKLVASLIEISDSGILASKDLSSILLKNVEIYNVDLCLTAFQKIRIWSHQLQ